MGLHIRSINKHMKYLDIDYIKENLRTQEFGQKLFYFDRLGSTNTQILDLAKGSARQGTIVIAEQQTAGRGRQGNIWYSPPRLGLYFSILLKPGLPSLKLSGLTLALGVSVAETIEKMAKTQVGVKWPNDLFCNSRKIGGILTELQAAGGLINTAIAGIGLNVNNDLIPLELCETASSILLESGKANSREDLLVSILNGLESDYQLFLRQGLKAFSGRLAARFYLDKKWVAIQDGVGVKVNGVVTGVDADGSLLLINQAGQTVKCSAGTVTEMER